MFRARGLGCESHVTIPLLAFVAVSSCVAPIASAQDSAQRSSLTLRVRTQEGRPIRDASVTWGADFHVSRTDTLGEVRLPANELARRIRIRAVGFAPIDTALGGWSGDTTVLTLRALAVRLDSIVVTAHGVSKPLRYANTTKFDSFYERRATAIGGKFFTREEIEQANSSSVYDLIRKVPGTKIERDQTGVPSCASNDAWETRIRLQDARRKVHLTARRRWSRCLSTVSRRQSPT